MADSEQQHAGNPLTAEYSEDFFHAGRLTVRVNPFRLAWGQCDHRRKRDRGEGDIHASYSADTIASSGRIRKSFRWQAQLMVTVSFSRRDGRDEAEAYRLVLAATFPGQPTSYSDRIGSAEEADAARNDPNGFYHGVLVRQGSETFVLAGPPLLFVPEEQPDRPGASSTVEGEQLSLF
jgi:hypothetical protein